MYQELHYHTQNPIPSEGRKFGFDALEIPSPAEIKQMYPVSRQNAPSIKNTRHELIDIIERRDSRLIIILGPCSIHDPIAALDYAYKLKSLSDKVSDKLFLVMRAYFEKPRTYQGWKGFINDPNLDNSFQIVEGIKKARSFLLNLCEIGLPIATEIVNPCLARYFNDLITWLAVGARTSEAQSTREMASEISIPVGFKNATSGDLLPAVNAILFSSKPHVFLGVNEDGKCSIVRSKGNKYSHIVLRGSTKSTNYDRKSIEKAEVLLRERGLPTNILVDCSHGNSSRDPNNQRLVLECLLEQILSGKSSIIGLMLESFLNDGMQSIPKNIGTLKYGYSITDPCIGWDTTEEIILNAYKKLI